MAQKTELTLQPGMKGEHLEEASHRATARGAVPEVRGNARRVVWGDFANRFCDPRECLASYLALESAEVIAGVKPANLLSIPDRVSKCGKNPYRLWKRWRGEVLDATPLEVRELTDRGNSALVLLYRSEALARLLDTPAVRAILSRAGYTEDMSLATVLDRLTKRLDSGTFPHEIGIFLGYPLKDVAGFMGLARIPFTCQGPWKIYGDPRASLQLAETFRCCRKRMAADLANCSSPYDCLSSVFSGAAADYCPSIENNIHNHGAPCV